MSFFLPPWQESDLEWEAFPFPLFTLIAKAQFSSSSVFDEEPSLVFLLISSCIKTDHSHSQSAASLDHWQSLDNYANSLGVLEEKDSPYRRRQP